MRVLVLAYPLTPLGPAACGGTEQIAWLLLRELARDGHFNFTCIAAPASRLPQGVGFVSWKTIVTAAGLAWPDGRGFTAGGLARFLDACQVGLERWLRPRRGGFDLIHNQGAYFLQAAARGAPVLFTLHLARELYPADLFAAPAKVQWQCVSAAQAQGYGGAYPVIGNGVDLERFRPRRRPAARDAPLLYLGRICPEKGADRALAIARRARRRLLLVGAPGPFAAHRRYFARAIAPRLGADAHWMAPPAPAAKGALLRSAGAVVVASRIAETSSLAAMEAAASGVPVLALRRGALPEIVAQGETGWLGDDAAELADAAARLAEIEPAACRARAERRFDGRRMAREYAALYRRVAA